MITIIHIITGLNDGGAESILYQLCTNDTTHKHIVISMMDEGKYGALLIEKNIKVYYLNMRRGRVSLTGFIKLYQLIKRLQPDIIQTWMYHADLIGGMIGRLAGINNIFWGIHHTNLNSSLTKKSTLFLAKINSKLSNILPKKIIFCANKALNEHIKLGYNHTKSVIIHNGYDPNIFKIKPTQRISIRQELKIDDRCVLLGMVGRYHPIKDHNNLLSALKLLKNYTTNFKCLLVGNGLLDSNLELMNFIQKFGLEKHVVLLGPRNDISDLMNALDFLILSSKSEAFPNVLAEAMLCGTPCISTDVGDASLIIDQYGWIIPINNSETLADAILEAISTNRQDRVKLQAQCRKHITNNFSINKMINNYHIEWGIK